MKANVDDVFRGGKFSDIYIYISVMIFWLETGYLVPKTFQGPKTQDKQRRFWTYIIYRVRQRVSSFKHKLEILAPHDLHKKFL